MQISNSTAAKRTTAIARAEAGAAVSRHHYAVAAGLYREAIALYPVDPMVSPLAARDLEGLEALARECEQAHARATRELEACAAYGAPAAGR